MKGGHNRTPREIEQAVIADYLCLDGDRYAYSCEEIRLRHGLQLSTLNRIRRRYGLRRNTTQGSDYLLKPSGRNLARGRYAELVQLGRLARCLEAEPPPPGEAPTCFVCGNICRPDELGHPRCTGRWAAA